MGGGGGSTPDLGPKFGSNFLAEDTVVFGSAAKYPIVTAGGAVKRGRERARSPILNCRPMAFNPETSKAFGKSADQHKEEDAAKARRLLRFGTEFGSEFGSRPQQARTGAVTDHEVATTTTFSAAGTALDPGSRGGSAGPAKLRDSTQAGRYEAVIEPAMETDAPDNSTSELILGICPDMCPEVERNERERKGDLDRFERLDGNRNQTTKDLAVKKYTRTAEKDAVLIRPLPVLKQTMGHLLSLLERDHEDDLLAVHNFLWDRMRAVRMDMRMQHIFTQEAVVMHEQMIRFHILAMHELCEYSQGEGISEVFNAHLNIEQMNKTSVDLFQMYDDHLKGGHSIESEAEFRGYYALLKLDKHPGHRVEPAELSLDLAKMTPEIRNSQEVRFARDVARACRASNFVAFFRLAREATYLQACLLHAHFSKLRTQALASLHSGFQKNYGIPLSTAVEWLGMEGEDIEALIKYHGFSIKYYEETYMVKEGPFLNKDQDFPIGRAQLVEAKRALRVIMDVQAERHLDIMTLTPSELRRNAGIRRMDFMERNGPPGSEAASIQISFSNFVNTKEEDMPDYIEEPVGEESEMIEVGKVAPAVETFKTLAEEETKQGKKRRMEELQFEAEEHERRRLRHEADAVARRAASQAAIEAAVAEIKRKEEQLRTAGHTAEANAGKQGSWFRKWRRRAAARALERRRKLLETEAALGTLSLGYPLWKMRVLGESVSVAQRNEYTLDLVEQQGLTLQQMWEPFDIPRLVGPILLGRNPASGFLYWKLFLSTMGTTSGQWVRTKVSRRGKSVSEQYLTDQNQLSMTLAEESTLMSGNHQGSIVDFRYSAKDLGSADAILHTQVALHGACALMFVAKDGESVQMEHARLHTFVQAVPEGANVPLLVLSSKSRSTSEQSVVQESWEKRLKLRKLSTSKISSYKIVSIAEISGSNPGAMGYFRDKELREGIVWLAKLCPVQPRLRPLHVADLVKEHVDAHMKRLLRLPLSEVNPNYCIKFFNQGLRNAAEEIVSIDSDFQKKVNDEGEKLIHSRQRFNSKEALEAVLTDLNSILLPLFPPLNPSLRSGSIGLQKLKLEQTLLQFLSLIEGRDSDDMAIKWEVSRMVQRGCTLEWHESGRKLVPKWGQICQAIFAARLLLLNLKPLPMVYIARIDQSPLQMYEFENVIHKGQIVMSPDFSTDGQLLLDDIIGEERHKHILGERESFSSREENQTQVTDVVFSHYTQVDILQPTVNVSHEMHSRPRTILPESISAFQNYVGQTLSHQGTSEWLINEVEEHRSKSWELAVTPSERLLDKILAELKQHECSPVRGKKVGGLNAKLHISPTAKEWFEPENYSCKEEVRGGKYMLALSPFEVLLDKIVAEGAVMDQNSMSTCSHPTESRFGIEEHRAKYEELQSSSWYTGE